MTQKIELWELEAVMKEVKLWYKDNENRIAYYNVARFTLEILYRSVTKREDIDVLLLNKYLA